MKKTYTKPALVKDQKLATITAGAISSKGGAPLPP